MSNLENTFKRYELKYVITQEERAELRQWMVNYVEPDLFGKSTICNIYYDTPDYRLIRKSLEKPIYKEKLRIRSYGRADKNSEVFVELKKKYQHVVYKRRIRMREQEAQNYLSGKQIGMNPNQISREIDYFLSFYQNLAPTVHLSYKREAFYGKEDRNLRITFDDSILWRRGDLSLSSEIYGIPVLIEDDSLMEVKVAEAMPLWLSHKLSEMKIYQTSFSKYGRAYQMFHAAAGQYQLNMEMIEKEYSRNKGREHCA